LSDAPLVVTLRALYLFVLTIVKIESTLNDGTEMGIRKETITLAPIQLSRGHLISRTEMTAVSDLPILPAKAKIEIVFENDSRMSRL